MRQKIQLQSRSAMEDHLYRNLCFARRLYSSTPAPLVLYFLGAGPAPVPGSSVCSWPGARLTAPTPSWLHTGALFTQGSSRISSMVALFLGSSSSMRPIICLLSRGRIRSNLHGPFTTSVFCALPSAALPPVGVWFALMGASPLLG